MSITQETVALSQIEKQRRHYQALSLTNFALTTLPAIAAGSRVEIGDTLFYVGVEQAITGWGGIANSTAAYIRIIPQGDGPPETALAEFTDVAPTWSDSKQGYYDATVAKRYIGGLYKDSGGLYTKKWLYKGQEANDNISRMRVTKNNAQSIPNATATIVQYDDEIFDNLEELASYRFTALEDGYYFVTAALESVSIDWRIQEYWQLRIYKNGAAYSYGLKAAIESTAAINYAIISAINDIVQLDATEYIDIRCYHNFGSAVNCGTSAEANYLAVHRLS